MNEFKVGILAITSMIALAYMSLKITSNQSGFGEYTEYRTIVPDATGIFPKTPIRVAGVNSGRIKSIELSGNSALISFELLSKINVPVDSFLRIRSMGFLGDKYLDVGIGKSDEYIKAGELIQSKEGASIEQIIKEGSGAIAEMKEIISSFKKSLVPEGEEPPVKRILDEARKILENTTTVTKSLKNIITNNENKFQNAIDNLDKVMSSLAMELDALDENSSRRKIKSVLDNAEEISENIRIISENVKLGKGTIGQLFSEDKIADEFSETMNGVSRIVNRLNLIKTEVSLFSGVNSDDRADNRLRLRVFPAPERFYLLGINNSPLGVADEKVTTTTQNGSTTSRTESQQEKNTIRFDAQMARKLHDWTIRGGLIESSGGIGLDYRFSASSWSYHLEAFDYREDLGFNLRFYTNFQLWNVFYAKAMVNDMANESRNYSVLMGVKFNDDDLQGLFNLIL